MQTEAPAGCKTFRTYRVVVGDVMLLEERNGNVTAPRGRVTGATQEHCKHPVDNS